MRALLPLAALVLLIGVVVLVWHTGSEPETERTKQPVATKEPAGSNEKANSHSELPAWARDKRQANTAEPVEIQDPELLRQLAARREELVSAILGDAAKAADQKEIA